MSEEEDETVTMLCDRCSDKLTTGENWLGALPLDNAFECMICHSLCCGHLLSPDASKTCVNCVL